VVALKRLYDLTNLRGEQEKQERRGGIETSVEKRCPRRIPSNQERRGGIETPGVEPGLAATGGKKQERRGGIETPNRREALHILSPKQERRGGIETTASILATGTSRTEAGTPWWH